MNEDTQVLSAMRELPDQWAMHIVDDGFSAAVINRLARRQRQRSAAVAATGSMGGAFASSQFLSIADSEPFSAMAAYALAPLQGAVTPEILLALLMAALAGSVAWVVPNRI